LHTESASTSSGWVQWRRAGATIAVMNVVVERGLARCPRCAATADYCFTECGIETIRYEVACRLCGELYCEENSTSPMTFSAPSFLPPIPVGRPAPGAVARLMAELRLCWLATTALARRAVLVLQGLAKDNRHFQRAANGRGVPPRGEPTQLR
jgi:hypothetical protein